jgi:WD40 repeat protein
MLVVLQVAPAEESRSKCMPTRAGGPHWWGQLSVLHADGRRAVTGTFGEARVRVRVWDLDTGVCLRTLEGHTEEVHAVALHADGRRAVTGGDDCTVRVWDLDTGVCLGTWCGADAFLGADLRKPLTSGRAHIAVRCGNDVLFFELMPPGPLTRNTLATWSPATSLVAAVLDSGAVILRQWHATSAHLEETARSAPIGAPVSSLRFSLDGARLQVLSPDGAERILDATNLQPATLPTCAWAPPGLASPDNSWRAEIVGGRLKIIAAT